MLTGHLICINMVTRVGQITTLRGLTLASGAGGLGGGGGGVYHPGMIQAGGWPEFLASERRLPQGRRGGWAEFCSSCRCFRGLGANSQGIRCRPGISPLLGHSRPPPGPVSLWTLFSAGAPVPCSPGCLRSGFPAGVGPTSHPAAWPWRRGQPRCGAPPWALEGERGGERVRGPQGGGGGGGLGAGCGPRAPVSPPAGLPGRGDGDGVGKVCWGWKGSAAHLPPRRRPPVGGWRAPRPQCCTHSCVFRSAGACSGLGVRVGEGRGTQRSVALQWTEAAWRGAAAGGAGMMHPCESGPLSEGSGKNR